MNFASAMFSMMCGKKVKRKHWRGYWYMNRNNEIIIHEQSGKELNIRETENIVFTLSNISCDDWEVLPDMVQINELKTFDVRFKGAN